ncbi:hypothetical protein WG66_014521 [Moniliophthora roreri]|nr:hypothetical protein WG66_014521 [Moniliophthora roreri]
MTLGRKNHLQVNPRRTSPAGAAVKQPYTLEMVYYFFRKFFYHDHGSFRLLPRIRTLYAFSASAL